jgi:hypothetical protein
MAIAFSVPFYRIPCASARLDVQLPAGEYGVDDEALTIPSDLEYEKPIDQVDIGNARANSRESAQSEFFAIAYQASASMRTSSDLPCNRSIRPPSAPSVSCRWRTNKDNKVVYPAAPGARRFAKFEMRKRKPKTDADAGLVPAFR